MDIVHILTVGKTKIDVSFLKASDIISHVVRICLKKNNNILVNIISSIASRFLRLKLIQIRSFLSK